MLTGWHSTQRIAPDGAVESEQRALLPKPVVDHSAAGALRLGATYWEEVQGFTRGLVRAREDVDGVELRAFGIRLLTFEPAQPLVRERELICAYGIRGGALARRPGGKLTVGQAGDPPEVRSTITGFAPRLAARPGGPRWTGALYSQVQRRVHLAVSKRYFRRLIRDAGP